jgi:hypothetical protein
VGNAGKGIIVGMLLLAAATGAQAQSPASTWSVKSSEPAAEATESNGHQRVIIAPAVLEGWSFLYRFITQVEFVLCLEGHHTNGTLYIDGFRLARMEAADISTVRYQPCSNEHYVGTAHNHPPVPGIGALCYRSTPDLQSFEKDGRAVVDVVLCGEEKYVWVLRDGTRGGPIYGHNPPEPSP